MSDRKLHYVDDYLLSLACDAARTKNNAAEVKTKEKKKPKIGNEEEKRRNKVEPQRCTSRSFVRAVLRSQLSGILRPAFFPCAFAIPWKLVRGFNDSEATRN